MLKERAVNKLKERTECFNGHRKIPPERMDTLAQRLKTILIDLMENGYQCFGAGETLRFDTLAAQTVFDLKTSYPHINLILVLPCLSQADSWSSYDQE